MNQLEPWLQSALRDAERRQLPALRPLLEALSRSTALLRAADWNLELTDQAKPSSDDVR